MPRIDRYFDAMLEQKASDLHLSPGYPAMLRQRGDLVGMAGEPVLDPGDIAQLVDEMLTPEQRATFARERDLDFAYPLGDRARFRGNLLAKHTGTGAVFRLIPSKILTLAELKVPKAITQLAEARGGLVLVTGPTGSGKSTTLAAMLDHINKQRMGHILTIEDPVEFVHRAQQCQITHREVGRDVVSFQEGMRSAGREDVDVILVGELRGAETMRLALEGASSGCLVFATVHTNSAAATIDRIINAFDSSAQPAIRGLLAESLTGVVAQQLLKTSDGKGRCAVHEILLGNRAVLASIREGKTSMLTSFMQSGRGEGMQGMDDTLLTLVRQGTISAEDARFKAVDQDNFDRMLQQGGSATAQISA